jgi:hypothetical protein
MRNAELSLAIAICRATFAEKAAADLELLSRTVRWDRFLRVAERHRIQALCRVGAEPINHVMPPAFAQQLRLQASAIVESNLRIAAESARLLGLFQSADLPLLFLKGLTLGALAYRDPFLKMGWDIDLLVGESQLAEAAQLLRSAGYTPIVPAGDGVPLERWHKARKESVWHRPQGGFHIDLHTRLADHPAMLPNVGMKSPSQLVPIANGIGLPTLAKDELFAYLCVHGASSAWFRLKWITDLAALLHGESADEIERLYDRSQQLGSGRAAAQALLLAERTYAIDIGDRLRPRLYADPINRWLVSVAEGQVETLREPAERFLGTASIHLSQPFLMPGWRFKTSDAARQLTDMIGMGAR